MPRLISIDVAAQELGISRRTVRRLISSGELPAYKVGPGSLRIKVADLDKVMVPVVPQG
jgi:excisionase family DNA binding protein